MKKEDIKKLRADLGLTKKEFAKNIFYSFDSVHSWENGRRKPSNKAINNMRKLTAIMSLR